MCITQVFSPSYREGNKIGKNEQFTQNHIATPHSELRSSSSLFTGTGWRQTLLLLWRREAWDRLPTNSKWQENQHERHRMDTYPFPGPSFGEPTPSLVRERMSLTRRAASGSFSFPLSAKAVGLRFSMRKRLFNKHQAPSNWKFW